MTTRVLMSYHYMRHCESMTDYLDRYEIKHADLDLFIDCGAFSALTLGAEITADEYGAWLARDHQPASVIASLDVIGTGAEAAEGTWRNYLTLTETFGIEVLPVVHVGEPLEYLDRYLDRGHDYIALGGLVGRNWKHVAPWVIECFRRAGTNAVFHGFGVTRRQALLDLAWYSVDSSRWGQAFRFGALNLFDDATNDLEMFVVSDRRSGGLTSRSMRFNRLARDHGFDPDELRRPGSHNRHLLVLCAAQAWQRYETSLKGRHGLVRRPSHPDAEPGLRLYLADSASATHHILTNQHHQETPS